MRRTVLPLVVAATLALGACSSASTDTEPTATQPSDAAPTTTEPQPTETTTTEAEPAPPTEEPADAPADEAEEPADAEFSTEDQQNPEYPSSVGTDGPLFPTGARVSSHDGYDRVVVDFEGTGSPGWLVRYVEEPVADDSGMEVDLTGDVVLRIDASGLSTPATEDFDVNQIASGHYDTSQADRVQDVYASGIFEGWSGSLVGLDETAPFRVFTLTEPTRLVVDISTEAG
jgi:hypothetical protein